MNGNRWAKGITEWYTHFKANLEKIADEMEVFTDMPN